MADEKDKTQNPAAGEGRRPGQAGARAAQGGRQAGRRQDQPRQAPPRQPREPPTQARPPPQQPPRRSPPARQAGRRRAKPPRRRAKAAALRPSRRRRRPAAEATASAAPAKPARKRAAAGKAATGRPAKAASAAAPSPARKAKARQPVERAVVQRAPDERVAVVVDADGKQVEEIKLSVERFGLAPDINLLHLAVRAEQAARRRGTASTKTRGEISGSTAKLYRQKGTGRARAGSVKSPTRSGGGTAFGPKPRSYEIKINRKAAHKALTMALSDRAEGGSIYVARGLELETPSTATVNELLMTLDIAAPVLVVTDDEPVVAKSVRNLRYAETGEARRLSVEQVLRNRSIVVTEKAFSVLTGA